MEDLSKKISNIEGKVKLLGEELIGLRAENQRLRDEAKQHQGSLFGTGNRNMEITPEENKGKLQKAAEVRKLKKEIDQYMKEIDKCIEWLQKS